MLDEAVALAFPGARTACFVEWEAYAQACLLARMEEKSLEPAPVWGDSLESFPSDQFAGCIDWIAAGFPCQPHSLAGKRQGVADERWIWESIAEIIREVGPRFVFLENVRGLLSSSAGAAFGTVLRDLAKLGFDVEWTVLRASEVGASHQRARLFMLAHRKGERFGKARVDHGEQSSGIGGCRTVLAHIESDGRKQGWPPSERIGRRPDAAKCRSAMADAGSRLVPEPGRKPQQRVRLGSAGSAGMADACSEGCEGCELDGACDDEWHGPDAHGSVAKLCGPCVFAPGPKSNLWSDIIATAPHLAPAVEPGIRMLVDGLAHMVDESRPDALRCAGNGVVALQAAAAFRHLARRLEIEGGD